MWLSTVFMMLFAGRKRRPRPNEPPQMPEAGPSKPKGSRKRAAEDMLESDAKRQRSEPSAASHTSLSGAPGPQAISQKHQDDAVTYRKTYFPENPTKPRLQEGGVEVVVLEEAPTGMHCRYVVIRGTHVVCRPEASSGRGSIT